MQDIQKAENTLLKYILILLSAFAINAIACKTGLIDWRFVLLGINYYVQTWTQLLCAANTWQRYHA